MFTLFTSLCLILGTLQVEAGSTTNESLLDLNKQVVMEEKEKPVEPLDEETEKPKPNLYSDEQYWRETYGIKCNPNHGDCLRNHPNFLRRYRQQ